MTSPKVPEIYLRFATALEGILIESNAMPAAISNYLEYQIDPIQNVNEPDSLGFRVISYSRVDNEKREEALQVLADTFDPQTIEASFKRLFRAFGLEGLVQQYMHVSKVASHSSGSIGSMDGFYFDNSRITDELIERLEKVLKIIKDTRSNVLGQHQATQYLQWDDESPQLNGLLHRNGADKLPIIVDGEGSVGIITKVDPKEIAGIVNLLPESRAEREDFLSYINPYDSVAAAGGARNVIIKFTTQQLQQIQVEIQARNATEESQVRIYNPFRELVSNFYYKHRRPRAGYYNPLDGIDIYDGDEPWFDNVRQILDEGGILNINNGRLPPTLTSLVTDEYGNYIIKLNLLNATLSEAWNAIKVTRFIFGNSGEKTPPTEKQLQKRTDELSIEAWINCRLGHLFAIYDKIGQSSRPSAEPTLSEEVQSIEHPAADLPDAADDQEYPRVTAEMKVIDPNAQYGSFGLFMSLDPFKGAEKFWQELLEKPEKFAQHIKRMQAIYGINSDVNFAKVDLDGLLKNNHYIAALNERANLFAQHFQVPAAKFNEWFKNLQESLVRDYIKYAQSMALLVEVRADGLIVNFPKSDNSRNHVTFRQVASNAGIVAEDVSADIFEHPKYNRVVISHDASPEQIRNAVSDYHRKVLSLSKTADPSPN